MVVAGSLLFSQSVFKPGEASSYPGHQTVGKVKFAAVKYESDEETHSAFGKVNPNEYGVLPIYFTIENSGDQTLMLSKMEVEYQMPDRRKISPMDAKDLPFVIAPKRPGTGPQIPVPVPLPKKKNPMAAIELQTRAFSAKTLLKGESASGFLYFQTRHYRDSIIYVTGIREGGTGKDLFYVEIPIDNPIAPKP